MECQSLFSEKKNNKKREKCRLLKILPSMLNINDTSTLVNHCLLEKGRKDELVERKERNSGG